MPQLQPGSPAQKKGCFSSPSWTTAGTEILLQVPRDPSVPHAAEASRLQFFFHFKFHLLGTLYSSCATCQVSPWATTLRLRLLISTMSIIATSIILSELNQKMYIRHLGHNVYSSIKLLADRLLHCARYFTQYHV